MDQTLAGAAFGVALDALKQQRNAALDRIAELTADIYLRDQTIERLNQRIAAPEAEPVPEGGMPPSPA